MGRGSRNDLSISNWSLVEVAHLEIQGGLISSNFRMKLRRIHKMHYVVLACLVIQVQRYIQMMHCLAILN